MQLRELKEIDGQLKQIILAIIICISGSKEYTDVEGQIHHDQELHPAFRNNLLTYVLVPHPAKV